MGARASEKRAASLGPPFQGSLMVLGQGTRGKPGGGPCRHAGKSGSAKKGQVLETGSQQAVRTDQTWGGEVGAYVPAGRVQLWADEEGAGEASSGRETNPGDCTEPTSHL